MRKMQIQLNDNDLIEICLNGVSKILPRFAVNYLLDKESPLLQKNDDFFSNNDETRLTYLLANGQQLMKDDFSSSEISLDDFPILQTYFEVRGGNFYDHVDFRPLLGNLQYNVSLGAHLLKKSSNKNIANFAFNDDHLEARNANAEFKLIGITKIKDEGALPKVAIKNWLGLCDHIIVSDASEFLTLDSDLLDNPNITIIDQVRPFYEKSVYDQLYFECRKIKATHILHFDVDEMLDTTSDLAYIRKLASKMEKGEALAVAWPQVYFDRNNFYTLNYENTFKGKSFHRLLPPFKDLIFCDDGHSQHCELAHHCPTIPQNFPIRRFYIDLKMYHVEGVIFDNAISKYNAWWDADYKLNGDAELAFTRYLPSLLKYAAIINKYADFESTDTRLEIMFHNYRVALQSNLEKSSLRGGMRSLLSTENEIDQRKPNLFDLFKIYL